MAITQGCKHSLAGDGVGRIQKQSLTRKPVVDREHVWYEIPDPES
ncbi:hypothetical protein CsSME_00039047 [Camellia sinensis var. sinensis]